MNSQGGVSAKGCFTRPAVVNLAGDDGEFPKRCGEFTRGVVNSLEVHVWNSPGFAVNSPEGDIGGW